MKVYMKFMILGVEIFVLLLWNSCHISEDRRTPAEIARVVADKVIRDSQFAFDLVPQEPVLGMQVLDFGRNLTAQTSRIAYALSYIVSDRDTSVHFGLSSAGRTQLFVNDQQEIEHPGNNPALPVEISYDRFDFAQIRKVDLLKGKNKILVRSAPGNNKWVVFLRLINEENDLEKKLNFSLTPAGVDSAHVPWLMLGPVEDDKSAKISSGSEFLPVVQISGDEYSWFVPKQNILMELAIDKKTTYQRESYLEWHYATGAMLWSMLKIPDTRYRKFVQSVCEFTRDNLYYFSWQYKNLYALRGSYHKIFRQTMLDDAGAPTLPYAELMLDDPDTGFEPLVASMSDYVRNEQQRLDNGAFCRPEPLPETVWADDLFMSVPFLLQLARLHRDPYLYDDAARQVGYFYALLFQTEKNLILHSWNNKLGMHSPVFWGRANGWVIWAVSEALQNIPREHPAYQNILKRYQRHIEGLMTYQDKSGMWHQVIDHPESYEETSSTAMFILAMARGLRNGWLDMKYRSAVENAWAALKTKIDADGTVHGICRGTGIGFNLPFYFNRQTFDNDPRGLGAVITAAVEMSLLESVPKTE